MSVFKLIQNNYNKETSSFEEFINELKFNLNSTVLNDSSSISLTDSVIVYCQLLEVPILNETEFSITVYHYLTGEAVAVNCIRSVRNVSICTTVECIIIETLLDMKLDCAHSQKQFMLKIHGKEEFVPIDVSLCQLGYIRECMCLNTEPVFLLVNVKNVSKTLSFKRMSNEFVDKAFYFELNAGNMNLIAKSKLENTLSMILSIHSEIQKDACSAEKCAAFRQSVLQLQQLIRAKVVYSPILFIMKQLEDEESLMRNSQGDANRVLKLVNDLMNACVRFCNCSSKCYDWNFELADDNDQEQSMLLNEKNEENICIQVDNLSNLYEIFDTLDIRATKVFYVRFLIYYGHVKLDEVKSKAAKFNIPNGSIEINDVLQFKNLTLPKLPREAVLVIKFCECPQLNDPKQEKCLAWASKALVNENLIMECGELFYCMFYGDSVITHTSASNFESDKAPVIYFCITNKTTIIPIYKSIMRQTPKNFLDLLESEQKLLLDVCNKNIFINPLTDDEKNLIRKYLPYLHGAKNRIRKALSKIYLSLVDYDRKNIANFYHILKKYDSLDTAEALEFLLPHYPDIEIRKLAVKSLKSLKIETLILYLPQLLQAVKYEHSNSSVLTQMLLECSAKNIRFAHRLYWYLREIKSIVSDTATFRIRYDLIYQGLVYIFPKPMIEEITQECLLIDYIDDIAQTVKASKNLDLLRTELLVLSKHWPERDSCRLPFDISAATNGIEISSCSFISSFTVPLKLVFKNVDSTASNFYTIYKVGDDLRQDMFVLQLINIMNQLWILNNHDLSVLTFNCLQTGDKRGFIEMITNAETLKEIQGSAINAFKKSIINGWLKSHNPLPQNFYKAVDNFTKSCAAYSVATYILGIGDRHNDNVMVKYSGHMFHIDFGKYLGDAQMFAGIYKRDRAPMLFTQDMFYVVNQGTEISLRFLDYIDLCCRAFQILREDFHLILTLMELLVDSNTPGLNKDAVSFVHKNLMIDLSEDEAREAFTNMILLSLNTLFSSINFAIHTVAQPASLRKKPLIIQNTSFDIATLVSVDVLEEKQNIDFGPIFKCLVLKENSESFEIYRSFNEFCELYEAVAREFVKFSLTLTDSLKKFKESNRIQSIKNLINDVFQTEIKNSTLILTFFNRTSKDQFYFTGDSDTNSAMFADSRILQLPCQIKGQIKIKLKYADSKFRIMVFFARHLKSKNQTNIRARMKTYLKPDPKKSTKQKIQALNDGIYPIFNQTIEYNISISDVYTRVLEISVNDKKFASETIGTCTIKLQETKWENSEVFKWFDLI